MHLKQNKIVIREATIKDAVLLLKWWNDGKVMAHAGFPLGLNTTKEEIIELVKSNNINHNRLILEFNDTPIGEMSYRKVDDTTVEIGIKICEFDNQSKGLGTRYLKLLISYLFDELEFEKIVLDTNLNNLRAQHVYEKLGFKKVRINYDSWKDQLGKLQSSVDYELTKSDYQSNSLKKLY